MYPCYFGPVLLTLHASLSVVKIERPVGNKGLSIHSYTIFMHFLRLVQQYPLNRGEPSCRGSPECVRLCVSSLRCFASFQHEIFQMYLCFENEGPSISLANEKAACANKKELVVLWLRVHARG